MGGGQVNVKRAEPQGGMDALLRGGIGEQLLSLISTWEDTARGGLLHTGDWSCGHLHGVLPASRTGRRKLLLLQLPGL